ncbi:hypothetical protein I79_006410 [Cricetulus griseus]|uniref:Uncharacterized protein n=1 Tax=Cricetulus griseus TaxID=10029 RepID=G3H7S2_CRIGR|nr:hypothetical protein I79_006410 [Cricetulus griseus]
MMLYHRNSNPKTLTKSSRDDVKLVHNSITLPNPRTPGSIQSYSMDFIHEGQGPILVGHITQFLQRTDGT